MTEEQIIQVCRDVGGIVHSDGNIFLTNAAKLQQIVSTLASQTPALYAYRIGNKDHYTRDVDLAQFWRERGMAVTEFTEIKV